MIYNLIIVRHGRAGKQIELLCLVCESTHNVASILGPSGRYVYQVCKGTIIFGNKYVYMSHRQREFLLCVVHIGQLFQPEHRQMFSPFTF